ncbi:MAG: aldo/keto reductase [Oscillospiraceae bacterium]|nr:aldo/keto reductase [Oscillospiraceae bacterium]
MIYKPFQNISLSRLGLGNMRLPQVNPKDPKSPIDYAAAHKIIDRAYAEGINYFDTAYVYNAGDSERCLGECMKKYPRDSFYLATKFNYGANPDYKAVFQEQLERLQTDHIDFYLLHCLLDFNIDNYLNCGCIEYFLKMKEEGKISYLGFSSHASPETLRRMADHHAWDFAQIQLNYFDWNYGTTKEEYQILEEHNIPIMVMEPVRGGRLSALTPDAEAVLKEAHPDWSISSWALRFVQARPQVQVILSGMSAVEQVEDNLNTFSAENGLSAEDEAIVTKAVEMFRSQLQVPCTKCSYCTPDCPMQINIPEYLRLYNDYKVSGPFVLREYGDIESVGKPTDCIGCGSCTGHCPQNINTPEIMAELAKLVQK